MMPMPSYMGIEYLRKVQLLHNSEQPRNIINACINYLDVGHTADNNCLIYFLHQIFTRKNSHNTVRSID